MDIWEEMYNKAKVEYHREQVSPFIVAHHVVSAVESEDGEMEILVDFESRRTVKLKDVFPNWWGEKRYDR